jgi:E3 ubiquitin-protein ligase DMA1/2
MFSAPVGLSAMSSAGNPSTSGSSTTTTTTTTTTATATTPPITRIRSKITRKHHKGLLILWNHGSNSSSTEDSAQPSGQLSSSTSASSASSGESSSLRSDESNLTPPSAHSSVPRPAENQSVGYFPVVSSNNFTHISQSAANPALTGLTPIEEDTTLGEPSPSSNPDQGRKTRSMTRRRTGSSSLILPSLRGSSRDQCQSNNGNSRPASTVTTPITTNTTTITTPTERVTSAALAEQVIEDNESLMTRDTFDDSASRMAGLPVDQMPTIKFTPHQDPRSNKPSLSFVATSRTLPHEGCVIRVGRYSERDASPSATPNGPSAAPVGFKSKVVSRRHCEFWCSNGQWYVRDVKSSSGTFLNHIRLSQPSTESRPFPVNDGDIVQLGMDFRGGEEPIFRCVKIRVECNRGWQKSLNNFK